MTTGAGIAVLIMMLGVMVLMFFLILIALAVPQITPLVVIIAITAIGLLTTFTVIRTE